MTPNPIGVLSEPGGVLAMELIRAGGRQRTFRRQAYPALILVLERLASDGYLQALRETPDEVTYGLPTDLWA